MIRINQIKMPINHNIDDLKNKISKILNIKEDKINDFIINKKSVDARKDKINYVYEVDIKINNEKKYLNKKNITIVKNKKYEFNITGTKKMNKKPLIIGSGPAGLFASYILAKNGYKPIIIERGEEIDKRVKTVEKFWKENVLNPNSNVQFGEGGAGTFSDGKLNTSVKDKENRKKFILETFVKNGAPKEILYINKPHIGSDLLRDIIKNMREEIIKMGGVFKYNSCLNDIIIKDNILKKVIINNQELDAENIILAIGHSSRDTFEMLLKRGLKISPKPFAIGIRIQHPQKMIDINQYGKEYKSLPKSSYKLTYKSKSGRGVYSFCMCPGGFVVNSSSEKNMIAINGMSNHKRNEENANSAIIVTISPNDFGHNPLDGINYQRNIEKITYKKGKGKIPVQLFKDFKENKISKEFKSINPIFKGNYEFANINEILPNYITESLIEGINYFDKKIKGFASDDAIIAATESRTSSPVKIERDENYLSNIKGIYPCGEGAGYAGGIMTAAMDGLKVAEALAKIYKPF